jgi:S-adenosylmethionine synthetase
MYRTAEFVSPSHPDKLCDRISDAILDEYLRQDPNSRCAIEVCGGHGRIFITGEVTSNGHVTKSWIQDKASEISISVKWSDVIVHLVTQSPEIAQGVDIGGAGDQGIMIGYACNDNEELVPHEFFLARGLNKRIYDEFPYDGKTQVTILDNKHVNVVCSFQNVPAEKLRWLCNIFFSELGYVIEELHCNPAGDWSIGGFEADAGLTGRKLAVDNYGPRVPIGGGAFSGKDSTKVDRSGAYMARRIAVDYLKKYQSNEVLVQLSYAIGHPEPLQATAVVDGVEIQITDYDLTPKGIIEFLDLNKPIYLNTSTIGHMGTGFSWK